MDHLIPMLQSLYAHQVWADTTILKAVADQPEAYADEKLRKLLHHIAVVQRFFLSLFLSREFDIKRESETPAGIGEMQQLFSEAHEQGSNYISRLDDAELGRQLEFPRFPDFHPAVRDALMQVIMHSEHHRAQCATRLRDLGGKPPVTDYIIWVRDIAAAAK